MCSYRARALIGVLDQLQVVGIDPQLALLLHARVERRAEGFEGHFALRVEQLLLDIVLASCFARSAGFGLLMVDHAVDHPVCAEKDGIGGLAVRQA